LSSDDLNERIIRVAFKSKIQNNGMTNFNKDSWEEVIGLSWLIIDEE
jgi:hypothetical protein